jgi:hypothetical protein
MRTGCTFGYNRPTSGSAQCRISGKPDSLAMTKHMRGRGNPEGDGYDEAPIAGNNERYPSPFHRAQP